MQKIQTPDGSVTFHNKQFDEAYHSKSGAKEEAMLKFVQPCNVKELAKSGRITILDVCFGLGYNTAMAIDTALEENPDCIIEVVGLENDEEILNTILTLDNSFTSYSIIKEAIKDSYNYEKDNIKIRILLGDALETIKQVKTEFDVTEFNVCFFDPFSPKKCPELWSEKMFSAIFKILKQNGKLATYSCARVVRDNMISAGFKVIDGPKVWRRGPSTIGIKEA
ncbi:hypothetical protein COV16_00945 [Candidatus Woesearchaeota archaeon CG10_big_fil_rev_8_21_14_0_10_34_8]|nr:MAG: hypothetical protein COV16_00945 [Candidatus Woesearchaeota archaeon CG10_big_fil_rev_8_21_14_0_10_34_8]